MGEISKTSSIGTKVKVTGTLTSAAIKGIPPALQRFYKFTKEMAMKFCRHLQKDRTEELVEAVFKELSNERP